MDILINIKNKIAVLAEPDQEKKTRIVCGNSDYTAVFSFDEEWQHYQTKTARFVCGGKHSDVVFEGNRCPIPVMRGVTGVYVGVFAGDLHTTTPAYIGCEKSILCDGGTPVEPTPDVYAQLMEQISGGAIKGEKGEQGERGEKGEDGYTPIKGVDYYTDAERAAIVSEISEAANSYIATEFGKTLDEIIALQEYYTGATFDDLHAYATNIKNGGGE